MMAQAKLVDRLPADRRYPSRLAVDADHPQPRQGLRQIRQLGEGHPLADLPVTYPGGRPVSSACRPKRVAEVRRWLANYHKLKAAIEAICELNHDLLRPDDAARRAAPGGGRRHD